MEIKDRLKQIRSTTGMTQHAFADRFNIPISTYEQWEMGIRKPPIYVVTMMETILTYVGIVNAVTEHHNKEQVTSIRKE